MMKSFRTIVSEVAQPRGPEEKKFKDMHSYETKSHPVAPDAVFTGAIGADDLPKAKAKRKADQDGDVNYDKQFKESNGSTMVCKDCGDEFGKPTSGNGCTNDCYDKNENCWIPKEDVNEAVGTSAKHAGKTGMFGGKYTSKDHIIGMKNFNKIRDKKSKQRDAEHAKQDPKMNKMGYAKHMLDTDKADAKARKRGIDPTGKYDKYKKKNGIREELDEATINQLEINEDLKMVSSEPHPKGGHIVTLLDKSGKKVIRHLKKGKVTDMGSRMESSKYDEETQLDEISKKTLGSYIKKAGPDAVKQTAQAKRHSDAGDMADKDRDMYKAYGKSQRAMDKAKNREKGISKAVDKLTKEATQVDEISKGLAGRYIKKAQVSTADAANSTERGYADSRSPDRDIAKAGSNQAKKGIKTFVNRNKGTSTAVDKLTGKAKVPAVESNLDENDGYHTVDIDHTGEHDPMAKKHNITLKKNKGTEYSHDASGKKKDLQKYLAHHYDSAEDAKDIHPEVHETTMSAVRKPVTVTGPDGKTRTVMRTTKNKRTDDHGQDIIKAEEAVDEGILDNIKKKVNDVRRKVVGPNQAEKDAARKKMMARQHASTMKRIGSAMGAVAKKDKKESKEQVNDMVKAALGGKTKVKESLLDMFASKLRGDSE